MSNDTRIRVETAVISLKQFTVVQLCKRTNLSLSQVNPVLASLKEQGVIVEANASDDPSTKKPYRPIKLFKITAFAEKLQELSELRDRLNQSLKMADDPKEDIGEIQGSLEWLEILLDVCDSSVSHRDLPLGKMEAIEKKLHAAYLQLESSTYKRAIDLRDPKNSNHPVVKTWNRWDACMERWTYIANQWKGREKQKSIAGILSPQASAIDKLTVISDPRFIDSSLFLWIFHQQPFINAGLAIKCIVEERDWRTVPECVAKTPNSIGFYNRRIEPLSTPEKVGYWSDLCIYRGYAVLAHKLPEFNSSPKTKSDTKNFFKRFFSYCHENNLDPTLISIGGDTEWRFGDELFPGIKKCDFTQCVISDANKALQKFYQDTNSLFVGGLPQRLQAEKDGYISIVDEKNNPALYSVNGIIYNTAMPEGKVGFLQSVASLWFDTVSRLKSDKNFRREVAVSIRDFIKTHDLSILTQFESSMFDSIFCEGKFEVFPETPAQITQDFSSQAGKEIRAQLDSYKNDKQKGIVISALDNANGILSEAAKQSTENTQEGPRKVH